MKNVTNLGDHIWRWRVEDWICDRCGLVRVSMNAVVAGCSRATESQPASKA